MQLLRRSSLDFFLSSGASEVLEKNIAKNFSINLWIALDPYNIGHF